MHCSCPHEPTKTICIQFHFRLFHFEKQQAGKNMQEPKSSKKATQRTGRMSPAVGCLYLHKTLKWKSHEIFGLLSIWWNIWKREVFIDTLVQAWHFAFKHGGHLQSPPGPQPASGSTWEKAGGWREQQTGGRSHLWTPWMPGTSQSPHTRNARWDAARVEQWWQK